MVVSTIPNVLRLLKGTEGSWEDIRYRMVNLSIVHPFDPYIVMEDSS